MKLNAERFFSHPLTYVISFVGTTVIAVAVSIGKANSETACFQDCQLQTIGRDFVSPAHYMLVHYCHEHDRKHIEPIPERVYFEMRDKGIPELRR